MVTVVPATPFEGLKPLIVGAGGGVAGIVTVNVPELAAVPPGVVTLHWPELAPLGTVTEICVAESTLKPAADDPRSTVMAPVKFVPLSVTVVPAGPLDGLKPPIVGAGGGVTVTVKVAPLVAIPPGVVTFHFPVAAPEGTATVIRVPESTV
jgi:hypothetical protein